jgi:hypothetical protein
MVILSHPRSAQGQFIRNDLRKDMEADYILANSNNYGFLTRQ